MDWAGIFIHNTTWAFAAEVALRAAVMFGLIIMFLRFTGKRGVRQLSIFELTIILSLGSIAGDPMFTEDLPIIQAVIIMSVVIGLYRLSTWFMMKYQPFEYLLEGKPVYIVENGLLVLEKIKQGKMSHDEFFSEMRRQGVEHLGQVRIGLLETDGNFSLILYPLDDTRYGLPLFPKPYKAVTQVEPNFRYACMYCGNVDHLTRADELCMRCKNKSRRWAKAINNEIVT
ncbi:DUF421 domain-containing protein [Psychrobacter sp. FME5]|uniref:DUF421 domain-containing protein n=1 Tax=Psychrobacter sp. FME5 TaxID=2487706 RepID=UPI00178794E4|nr:YetF domain-containing protein [Psychrobacter sp. FME5]MBE0444012.1 DUF421 domain-containing protein [Psychrobacter sp. FME5]MDN5802951.1 DUF421 domain-containing protein [Psychrobacter sp.]MDN5890688.1 DUF421 domain-containing protein [Psychrobacter sp.]